MKDFSLQDEPPFREAGMLAAVLVFCGMLYLETLLTGPRSADWRGYARLFDDEGGWLSAQGRDPAFIWVMAQGRKLFGVAGYEAFRTAIFAGFAGFAVWLVHAMPVQRRVSQVTVLITALIVLVAFSLKGFVQIREGMAFVFIVGPLVSIYGRFHPGIMLSGLGAVIAATFHSGTAFLFGGWLAAVALLAFPDAALKSPYARRGLLLGGSLTGLLIAYLLLNNAAAVKFLLHDFGVDESAQVQSNLWKTVYWGLNGVIAWTVRRQLHNAVKDATRFAFTYATALGSFLLPLLYALCVTLVAARFPTPALTAMMLRLFYTTLELALIIVALRGRANLLTFGIAAFMMVDRMRLVLGQDQIGSFSS